MSDVPAPKYRSADKLDSRCVDPRHVLAAAGLCWLGFALVAGLVLTGHAAAFDRSGLLYWRTGATLALRGPAWLLDSIRDVTALGDIPVRYALAGGAVIALLAARMRRAAIVFTATILSGWLVEAAIKLAEKHRDGARVHKRYHKPATPYQRLLADPRTSDDVREKVTAVSATLDPVRLLRDMRTGQQRLVEIAGAPGTSTEAGAVPALDTFLTGLRTAWQGGEVRPAARDRNQRRSAVGGGLTPCWQ